MEKLHHERSRIVARCLCCLLCSLLLSGCWDRTEINDLGIALASAIDKEGELYRVTVQMALPGQMGGAGGGGGGTGGTKSYYVDSDVGKTIREAYANLQQRMARRLFFSHRRVLIVGEDLAKEDISELFDVLSRVYENRLTAYMIIAQGKGYDLLNASPKFERFSAEAIRDLAQSQSVMKINIKEVAQSLNADGEDPVMTYMGVKKSEKSSEPSDEISILGYAQFRNGAMVGVFEKVSMEGIQWLRNQVLPFTVTLLGKQNKNITLQIGKGQTNIQSKTTSQKVHFDIEVRTNANVLENMNREDLTWNLNKKLLEQRLAAHIKKSIQTTLQTMQEHQADSCGLGMYISREQPRLWQEHYKDRWADSLGKATFTIHVQTKINRIGLTTENIAQ